MALVTVDTVYFKWEKHEMRLKETNAKHRSVYVLGCELLGKLNITLSVATNWYDLVLQLPLPP